MDNRPPATQVWRPQFARNRNRRDSNASDVDDRISDTSERDYRSRSPHRGRGGGAHRRGMGRRNPNGSGRLGDLRDQLNASRPGSVENLNTFPASPHHLATGQRQEEWQEAPRGRNKRGGFNKNHHDSDNSQWQGKYAMPPPPNRGNQGPVSNGPNRQANDAGPSGYNGPSNQRYSGRGGRNSSRFNNRSIHIKELVTMDDWTNLSNLGNSLRILTKLQEFETAWVKAFHTDAPFELIDIAFGIFTDIDVKYRYAKLAMMKSLFTNKFIERIVLIVDKFKTTWFQAGKDKIVSFLEKLRNNVEFLLSNDAAFHDDASSKNAIISLIDGCVGTLGHINKKLVDLQGSPDPEIEKEISLIRELSNIKFIEMMILDEPLHPDDFRAPFNVLPNIIYGAYESDDHYIQTQFSLLKEDFQSVLRDGVEQYLVDPKKKNFSIWAYENVVVKRFYPTHKFLQDKKIDNRKQFFMVTFPECRYFSKINWKYDVKRFMFGSLVVLTEDKFNKYHLALIEERNLDNPDNISIIISFIYAPPNGVEDSKFLLVEPKVFYEPYLNSMKVLKHMAKIGLPLKKFIVKADTCPSIPAYLKPESVYKIGSHNIKINDMLSWPKAEELGLNRSQKEAFINALTSEMALIQGPPGTGKTFLAFKIIDTLLKNRTMSYVDGPIMIVCFKNHSLDQILEGLLNMGRRVVRIGGQSKVKALKYEFNVRNLPAPPTISSLLSEKQNLHQKLRTTLFDIKKTVTLINVIKSGIGILNVEFLKQFQIVAGDIGPLDVWLLEMFEEAPQIEIENIVIKTNSLMEIPDIKNLHSEGSLSEVYHGDLLSIGKEVIDCGLFLSKMERHVQTNSDHEDLFWEVNERYWSTYNRYTFLLQGLDFPVVPSDFPGTDQQDFNYFDLELEERWALYRKWEIDLVKVLEARLIDLQNQVPEIEENLSEYEEMVMSQTLKYEKPQVIGITTSGATKHYSALADVGAKIVLVEEAAEVLEAHVIASLSTKCQHLILIGDHQQLKPNTASHDIGTRYRLNVSLFERMIKNEIKYSSLAMQHRMRPEISALICPAIYKNLENHPKVHSYPPVIGTKTNVYFFNHDHLEQLGYDSESKYNPSEGDMLISIAYYLLRQGYKPDQLTILSTYLEQDRYIKKAIDRQYAATSLKEVFCTVVDNYQGEENIIILLSLVRSNLNGDVGFLSTKNRVCVALSRAKHGLFIFGNMSCLSKKEPTIWSDINTVLIEQESIGNRFPLKCVRHGNITEVASPMDVDKLEHAGCSNPCNAPLPCGHTCRIMCHGQDQEHVEEFRCREKCMKRCENLHTCQALCRNVCPPCPFMMPKVLVCGHSRQLECHKANLQAFCSETVEIKLERCGHHQLVLCKFTEQSERHRIVCKSDCKQTFKCGHVCKRTCHVLVDPNHVKFLCEEPCELINKSCPRKHKCRKKCRDPCGDCLVMIEKTLPCGHKGEMKCCQDAACFSCHQPCTRKLPCGHDCVNECCDPCGPCKIKVEKVIEECGHKINFKCSDVATRSHCKQPCRTIKTCGHQCTGMCKEICENLICVSQVKVELPCGHEASVSCGDVQRKRYAFTTECKAPCQAKLPCGHRCKGTCGSCLQGRVHIPCDELCRKPLLCNHKCRMPCSLIMHSCFSRNCFNICWRDELKNQPNSFKQIHGKNKKKAINYNPRTRMAYEIRSELNCLNEKMGKIARKYNRNNSVVGHVKMIQLFVNKSRAIIKDEEELANLKTCLFKVEYTCVVFAILRRLADMNFPDLQNLELETLIDKLVIRAADNRLIGSYEMTQLQEQLLWVSLSLDIHNMVSVYGQRNDSAFTDSMFRLLNDVKSSFGSNQRVMARQMLQDYNKKMNMKLPVTDVDLEGLFPVTDRFCQPIYHHRVDHVLDTSNHRQCGGLNHTLIAKNSKATGSKSLVSEEYNEEEVVPKKAKNRRKRSKEEDAAESMEIDAGSVAEAQCNVDEESTAPTGALQSESNLETAPKPTDDVNTTSDNKVIKEKMQQSALPTTSSPYTEASNLLGQMLLHENQPSHDSGTFKLLDDLQKNVASNAANFQDLTYLESMGEAQQKSSSTSLEQISVDSVLSPACKLQSLIGHGIPALPEDQATVCSIGHLQELDQPNSFAVQPGHANADCHSPQSYQSSRPLTPGASNELHPEAFQRLGLGSPAIPASSTNHLGAPAPTQSSVNQPLWNIQSDPDANVFIDEID